MACEENAKFRCRLCRFTLFETEDISKTHNLTEECSSWFLRDDEGMLSWVQTLIDEAGWTEGKLYCPKCNARVGGFDFVHSVPCSCGNDVIPAIWCPKSKIDHMKTLHRNEDGQRVKLTAEKNQGSKINPSEGNANASRNDASNTACCNFSRENSGCDKDKENVCVARHCHHTCFYCHTQCQTVESFQAIKSIDNSQPALSMNQCGSNVVDQFPQCGSNLRSFNGASANDDSSNACYHNPERETLVDIHQELEQMRQEVMHLTRMNTDASDRTNPHSQPLAIEGGEDTNLLENAIKVRTKKKRKNKARRRSRGNWVSEPFFMANSRRRVQYVPDEYSQTTNLSCKKVKEDLLELSDSEIPDCYKCSVCLSLLYKPHKTPCSHVFCGPCLRHLNVAALGRPKCPLCREPVRSVECEDEVEQEIKEIFPANYRRRTREERKNKHRKSPLPSSSSYDGFNNGGDRGDQQSAFINFINVISIIAMILSVLIHSLVVNAYRLDARQRRNLVTKLVYTVVAVIGGVAAVVTCICLVIFAVDFFKIALFLIAAYFAITKFLLRAIVD
eukprot:gene9763-10762_t